MWISGRGQIFIDKLATVVVVAVEEVVAVVVHVVVSGP